MKIVTFIFLLSCSMVSADTFQTTLGFELGYRPFHRIATDSPTYILEDTSEQVTRFDAELVAFEYYFLRGAMSCFSLPPSERGGGSTSFKPLWLKSDFSAGITAGPIEVGFKHMCAHPVVSGPGVQAMYNEAYEEFYIRIAKTF